MRNATEPGGQPTSSVPSPSPAQAERVEQRASARPATRRAADAIIQALAAPALSLDALRRAVVRYGHVARDLALAPDEMIAALGPVLRRCVRPELPGPELRRLVQWWAIHGYHRAD